MASTNYPTLTLLLKEHKATTTKPVKAFHAFHASFISKLKNHSAGLTRVYEIAFFHFYFSLKPSAKMGRQFGVKACVVQAAIKEIQENYAEKEDARSWVCNLYSMLNDIEGYYELIK